MNENTELKKLDIPAGPLAGTVRTLVAAVGRLAEENLMLRGLLESIHVQVEEPDGGVLEIGVDLETGDDDRAWLAAVLRRGAWTDEAAYAAWLRLARALGETLGEWEGVGAEE